MFEYRAKVTAVYDADTITVDIDLGFHAWQKKMKLRFYGIDAPEMRGKERPDGLKARDWLRQRILGNEVTIITHKDKQGKYGRWLAEVYPADEQFEKSFNVQLVDAGLAKTANY